jgi:hypothetical protein
MAKHKPIKWARAGKVAGLVVAGVAAVVTGALPAWNWVPIPPLPSQDGSNEQDGKDHGQTGEES